MKNTLNGFIPVKWTDQEFAAYLHEKDINWTHKHIIKGEISLTHFINTNDKIIAIVKYKNSYPINRWIWIPETNF